MGRFLEVTVVDGGDEWPKSVRLSAIQTLEPEVAYDDKAKEYVVRDDLTRVVFEGGVTCQIKIGYEELKGILEGRGPEAIEEECGVLLSHAELEKQVAKEEEYWEEERKAKEAKEAKRSAERQEIEDGADRLRGLPKESAT